MARPIPNAAANLRTGAAAASRRCGFCLPGLSFDGLVAGDLGRAAIQGRPLAALGPGSGSQRVSNRTTTRRAARSVTRCAPRLDS
ncbi:hypothetical protein PJI17_10030 [Mycobacterium kansasii]